MKLSTRARYGLRALLDLALFGGNEPVLLKDIAQRQGISLAYLEHLISPLIAGGVIRSVRGPQGGVWLAKAPREIKLNEVFRLLEGSTSPVECIENPDVCPRSGICVTRELWDELGEAMDKVLSSTTLLDLVERQKGKGEPAEAMYYI